MKKLLPYLSLILLAACDEKGSSEVVKSGNILENLNYSIDTLLIDSGDEIFNLKYGLHNFSVIPNSNTLIFFDNTRNIAQWVDLENQKLIGQTVFQKDGPNGLGNLISLQTLQDETMMLASFNNTGIFNKEGERIAQFNLKPHEIEGLNELNPFGILTKLKWDSTSKKLFSLPGDMNLGIRKLAIVDPVNQKGKLISLPKMDLASNFRVTYFEEGGGAFEEVYDQQLANGQLFITCSVSSGIYRYDPKLDNLTYLDFSHQIIPNEKKGDIVNDPNSPEEWWQEYKKVVSQISYWGLHWEESTSRFYRLASRSHLGETRKDPVSYEVFLLVYDKELNLLGESLVKGYNQFPQSYFFKDGKLWSYVNVEDELGFAVFTFDF